MSKNQIDYEAIDLTIDEEIHEEVFLIDVINLISENVISDENFEKNNVLITHITSELRRRGMSAEMTATTLELMFSSIATFGLR